MPILDIDSGDFVNQGRDKVNQAFGEIPVSLEFDPVAGDLILGKHNNEELRLNLANFFPTLQQIANAVLPGNATTDKPGLIMLGDEEIPEHLDSETRVLTAAGVVRYVESIIGSVPSFAALVENTIPIVRKRGTTLYIDFVKPIDHLKSQDDDYFKLICEKLTALGCAGGGGGGGSIDPPAGKTIIGFVGVDGPDSIDEGVLTSQFLAIVTYNDGSTGKLVPSDANGFVRSIIGQGETISATGVVPIYSNYVSGDTRQFTVRIGYKLPGQPEDTVRTKVVTINDKSPNTDVVLGDLLIPYYIDTTLPDFFGQLDGGDCASGFGGWGVNFANPEVSVKLDILRDSVKVDEITVSRTRSDVSDFYGLTNNTGHKYGFSWPIPDQYKDSQTHRYTARFTGSTVLLNGDPIALTCLPPDNAACPNLANLSTGGTASASSSVATSNGYHNPERAFNGDRSGFGWGNDVNGSGWTSSTGTLPEWLARDFGKTVTIQEFELVGLQDNVPSPVDPTDDLVGSAHANVDFDIQIMQSGAWVTVPGGSIRDNNKVIRRVRLAQAVQTSQMRVLVSKGDNGYSRVIEFIARACLTGPADQPTTVRINGAPATLNEGTGVDLTGQIIYPDGRIDTVTAANGTWQLAAETGDYDVASGTHTATASDCLLGNNGRFTANNNNTRNDTRNVRIKLSAYGLSDTKTVQIIDKTPAPVERVEEIAVTTTALDYTQNQPSGSTLVDCFMLWRVTGNPVLWVGVYTTQVGQPDSSFTIDNAGTSYADLTQPTPHPKPAEWNRFTRLAGINTVNRDYRVRIDARAGGPTGTLLASHTFVDGLPMKPIATIYTAP